MIFVEESPGSVSLIKLASSLEMESSAIGYAAVDASMCSPRTLSETKALAIMLMTGGEMSCNVTSG